MTVLAVSLLVICLVATGSRWQRLRRYSWQEPYRVDGRRICRDQIHTCAHRSAAMLRHLWHCDGLHLRPLIKPRLKIPQGSGDRFSPFKFER